jgi:hypothetical protein
MNQWTIKSFVKAIRLGSKYVYQTVPRLLTLWLDLGENEKMASQDIYAKINDLVDKTIKSTPMYKVNISCICGNLGWLMLFFSGTPLSPRWSHAWNTTIPK